MKQDAIHNLYPNVVCTITDEEGNITALDANENVVEITDWNAVETKATELQTEYDAKIQAKEDLKASAKAKLIAGEALTEEEANTIVL
tara:strand:- start:147 stop:410 length:264 start_codon:yes stop_codon:yes gene_type:complete